MSPTSAKNDLETGHLQRPCGNGLLAEPTDRARRAEARRAVKGRVLNSLAKESQIRRTRGTFNPPVCPRPGTAAPAFHDCSRKPAASAFLTNPVANFDDDDEALARLPLE